ncbi:dynein heavy chain, cytosolic [Protomyces lactucae-debilis]|uniref:Dynein heavy chain, cytoplasmic n=1 Tax=Protomyces lactucae-debilis TaxID=2754530 RepID=A0A1Y2FBY9_PROLT|nr:dynein heavy chain, cytosolic [Protomyces lactucae-debilis]ORY81439.1 dynein heavy chain, cytosolic [Protomyces lactucae-debilis]
MEVLPAALPSMEGNDAGNALTLSPQALADHVTLLLTAAMGATSTDTAFLRTSVAQSRLERFVNDAACLVLFVRKDEEPGDERPKAHYAIDHVYQPTPNTIASLALIKLVSQLDAQIPLERQVQIINLPGHSAEQSSGAYEALHSLIKLAIAPYFDTFAQAQQPASQTAKTGIPNTRKKIAELELSLLHLQQNTEIPRIVLVPHPTIQKLVNDATARQARPSVADLDQDALQDAHFLNAVQATVSTWKRQIHQVTSKERDPSHGTASQEISFWLSLDEVLADIQRQLESPAVVLTTEVLQAGRRFGAALNVAADTGIRDARDQVWQYTQLMRDFPLDELLSATSLVRTSEAVAHILNHLSKKLRTVAYPISRALPLVEAISGDLTQQLHNLLKSSQLMTLDLPAFQLVMEEVEEVFATWDDRLKEFQDTARDMLRKRGEKFTAVKTASRHAKIQERLAYLKAFRLSHEQLQATMMRITSQSKVRGQLDPAVGKFGHADATAEVSEAFQQLKDVDVLDVTPSGTELWIAAEARYNERIARVENAIISQLRERLGGARNANEMFRVFTKFSALLVRPKIRGAVQEYQKQLLEQVKGDIAQLHERFNKRYIGSDLQRMDQLRDLPLVCGTITWTRQLNHQLDMYMSKVETVLGEGWHMYADGEKLQAESAHLRKQLDTRSIFDAWLKDVQAKEIKLRGALVRISRNRAAGNKPELTVNFDSHIITLFKEVRNLLWLGFQVSHSIISAAKDAQRLYPYAVSLVETIKTISQTADKIDAVPDLEMLLAQDQVRTQHLLEQGFPLQWENFVGLVSVDGVGLETHLRESRHIQFVKDLASSASSLQANTELLVGLGDDIRMHRNALKSCEYGSSSFRRHLSGLQMLVDQLNRGGFSNIVYWVEDLNASLEEVLGERLHRAIEAWLDSARSGRFARSDKLLLDIHLNDQSICVTPPLARIQTFWQEDFQNMALTVCKQKRIRAAAAGATGNTSADAQSCFDSLMFQIVSPALPAARETLAEMLAKLQEYVDNWLGFQSLWDLQPQAVYEMLGDDLAKWLQLLNELRKSRTTFDTSSTATEISGVTVQYGQVQARVNAKFDAWQKLINAEFANQVAIQMQYNYEGLAQMREELEKQTMDTSSTAAAVEFVIAVQRCKRQLPAWQIQMDHLNSGEKILKRQRYQFPSNWLQHSQVESEWVALQDIHERRSLQGEEHADSLRTKLKVEDGLLQTRLAASIADWIDQKPVGGDSHPEDTLKLLQAHKLKLKQLSKELDDIEKAKEALNLPTKKHTELAAALGEVEDLQSVWAATSSIWVGINELRETLWAAVVPRKVRSALEALVALMKDMPSKMRQYAAYEHVQSVLKQHLKTFPLLVEMKADAVRDRHWTRLYKELRPTDHLHNPTLTLGDVWSLRLSANDKIIRSVLIDAQGELALEEFLLKVKEAWTSQVLELINYQNKCRLIKGWDELLAKCSEHLTSLQAMAQSAYYKHFEEEARLWEDKLNRLHVLFDVWVDVQRQWVYLEGIFANNADIQRLLPTESSRFQNINSEFMAIMKKVSKSPLALEVLNIPGALTSMERLADLLQKIQKALGEYLERERAQFPRFYFVGDEDLLEILGNSKDLIRVQKHLKKMFAGINSLLLDDTNQNIVGFFSKEGEHVELIEPVSTESKINEWLLSLENAMKAALAQSLRVALPTCTDLARSFKLDTLEVLLKDTPCQVLVLAFQCEWTTSVETALASEGSLAKLWTERGALLDALANTVLTDLPSIHRAKAEALITTLVHQRDCIAALISAAVCDSQDFRWLGNMRFYTHGEHDKKVTVNMANAEFDYGFEYIGLPDRLVQTPLTDRCFLTLTQALEQGLGGSPFGPAGTGKTESVKSLGVQLGRFVLVFCCDDTFDYQAMGRIFLGLCQVGAWGCFDEFNRLEERILSAVSQQIQTIQTGLHESTSTTAPIVSLLGRSVSLNPSTGIFITMNPGYAGRSNLPDNLKKLFRSVAMTHPDRKLIAQVTFFAQGFSSAVDLAGRIVPFFVACAERMSEQPHYDFGLRALKSVLTTCGQIKRQKVLNSDAATVSIDANWEAELVLQSLKATINPKMVGSDAQLLNTISEEVFPGTQVISEDFTALRQAIDESAKTLHLVTTSAWEDKIVQIHQIQTIHHGFMLVGPAATSKTKSLEVLKHALEKTDGIETIIYKIDAKVMSKEELYGRLDITTREWSDGLFTSILRKIVDNLRGEDSRRYWIVFDGDIDPIWVENMNSMLDDNKILTLPTGERLSLPNNVRIVFEVDTLKHATPATVSRCGMVYFDSNHVTVSMQWQGFTMSLQRSHETLLDEERSAKQRARQIVADQLSDPAMLPRVESFLEYALEVPHIMEFTQARALQNLFGLLHSVIDDLANWDVAHADFPLTAEQGSAYTEKQCILAFLWSFGGDCALQSRQLLAQKLISLFPHVLLPNSCNMVDLKVTMPDGTWAPWSQEVRQTEVEPTAVAQPDLVIPTTDTVRNEDRLYSWLSQRQPVILCGPPGSGKTMSLTKALNKLPHCEQIGLNFSSASAPDLLQRTLEQYCKYTKSTKGVVMQPRNEGQWLVMFCDEINLPAQDTYGSQRIIGFLRQLVEQNGFWRQQDQAWVSLERIQFVGACNPPTDVGRTPFSQRFLRHAPVLMVDYPESESLTQIYGTFVRAVLKFVPALKGYADALTAAMIDVFDNSRTQFTAQKQAHYIYSPRELSRWIRGIAETLKSAEQMELSGLVRIWAHEALRLFSDRLVNQQDRDWTTRMVMQVAQQHFPNIDETNALEQPMLYSNWLSKDYRPVGADEMRFYIKARLKTFCEEEVDTSLVLYDDAIDHVLRIDRVFRQPQGHLILIGLSGSGKTTLARFVAWMNGMKTFQIKVHGKYTAEDFDDDLRHVLRRCGTGGEKICFILNESNMLESGFLERMNTLLANANVPGLFENDEYATLMTSCKQASQREGLLLDSQEELYNWFTQQVSRNLHVVFTMNPPDNLSAAAATSPALFNRCVLNWFGGWSPATLFQVAYNLSGSLDLDQPNYTLPSTAQAISNIALPQDSRRHAVVNALGAFHLHVTEVNADASAKASITPRHFLDLVHQLIALHDEERQALEDSQRHLNLGLQKLQSTVTQVAQLKRSLASKQSELTEKNALANEKLQRMVADQQEAEQKKIASLEIQESLAIQDKEINERRQVVLGDLALAEPAVIEAQKSVSNIKKQQLTEVRSMNNPPEAVKLAMEAVCTLLGHHVDTWKAVQGVIRRDDFISSIVRYDNETQMTPQLRRTMRLDYMDQAAFQYENVNRASKACGPLVQWVTAQVSYSEILDQVGPLRDEVATLEKDAILTRKKVAMMMQMIRELEESIAQYKEEYAALISEVQAIKTQMAQVEHKVQRSVTLLDSLASEQARWSASSAKFQQNLQTLLGNAMLSAAMLAYAGFYDHTRRQELMNGWQTILEQHGIAYQQDKCVSDMLVTPEERLAWEADGLPPDSLCVENALIIKRAQRYPLIIDPSSQALAYLVNSHKSRKLVVTSFMDDSFIKQLETCIRFGSAILIRDAEKMDPIINKLLNKEYQRTGGRTLVELGKQDVDISPSFKLYLSTRDPSASFAPDISSKVTLVNFTITKASLKSQSLDKILLREKPDVEARRLEMVKSQGEYQALLRRLEQDLLRALNESRGNILDDEVIIDTLERLKREAGDIAQKIAEADGVMEELATVANEYAPAAETCCLIFAVLEQFAALNHFYQFSLQYFEDMLRTVLAELGPTGQPPAERTKEIQKALYKLAYQRVRQSLLHKDHLCLALTFALVSREHDSLAVSDLLSIDEGTGKLLRTAEEATRVLQQSVSSKHLSRLAQEIMEREQIGDLLTSSDADGRMSTYAQEGEELPLLVLIKRLRPDLWLVAANKMALSSLGEDSGSITISLNTTVQQVSATTPIMLTSVAGYDASFKVEQLIQQESVPCASIAMGSPESITLAERALTSASASGSWVLLKNVHLAAEWLSQLEKRVHALTAHKRFRLFLTTEASPHVPTSLIRNARVVMSEPPPGLRASMLASLKSVARNNRAMQPPTERVRLYVLLAWLHGIIQERLKFGSLGWSKGYEFNDADFEAGVHVIDAWLQRVAAGRGNIAPDKIPWLALQRILSESVYGGRIDELTDQEQLTKMVQHFFSARAFDLDFSLVEGDSVQLPETSQLDEFLRWISIRLPEKEPPTWLGLQSDAECYMLAEAGVLVLKQVSQVMDGLV